MEEQKNDFPNGEKTDMNTPCTDNSVNEANAQYTQNANYYTAENSDSVSDVYQKNYNYNVGSSPSYIPPKEIDDSVMTLGDWIITILLTSFIPCVNIIMLCVWGFSSTGNINRRNYCRAMLIFQAISYVFAIILYLVMFFVIFNELRYY